jgi:hypothetical protein
MRIVQLTAMAAILAMASPAVGQSMNFERLGRLCRDTAQHPPTELARRIVEGVELEHKRFDGHEIDATGRMFRFGHVEAEGGSGDNLHGVSTHKVPWRAVLRYWEVLSEALAKQNTTSDAQSVTYYPGILAADADQPVDRHSIQLGTLLSAIEHAALPALGGSAERVREALRESVIRASLVDVPWSAAFISAMLRLAGVPDERFAFSARHIDYISQAVLAAKTESNGEPVQALYRACDPYNVRPRAGDLLCYHRHAAGTPEPYTPKSGMSLFRSLVADISEEKEPISRSHCDVVTDVSGQAKKVRAIGGNVHQAVTVRTLNLNQNNALSTNQRANRCPGQAPGRVPDEMSCSLNAQAWFVLLQMRSE